MTQLPKHEKTILANGVRVVTEHIPTVRSVAVGAWVHAGSRDEQNGEAGLTHFIEHIVFKGTTKRRMHHIAQRMESVGGYLNAFTSKEYTCYHARALDEHLPRALDVVLDLILNPTLPEKEIEKEKEVVVEEMKMYEDVPEDLIFDRFEGVVYDGHELSHPVLGVPETVQGFTKGIIQDYMLRHYGGKRLVVAVSGNVNHRKVVDLVARQTNGIAPGVDAMRTIPPPHIPQETVEARPIQQAHIVIGGRGIGLRDERRSTLSVLNALLGGGMSSRLNQNIREKYGFCYNIYSFANQLADTGDFGVYMGTDERRIDKSRKLILRELQKLATAKVSDRQLIQAKNQLRGSLMLGLESMNNRMMQIGRVELTFGRPITLDEITDSIERVTAEDVRALSEELFAPDNLSTVVLTP